jgi:hypothetical protein
MRSAILYAACWCALLALHLGLQLALIGQAPEPLQSGLTMAWAISATIFAGVAVLVARPNTPSPRRR